LAKITTQKVSIAKHVLTPHHSKLSDKDKKDLLERYNISFTQIPKILSVDAALTGLDVKQGDIIKIVRKSPTAGEAVFYRGVV